MNLDEAQRKSVAQWIEAGARLSEIQNRITAEFGVSLTYMEVRLLVADLKLMPKNFEPRKTVEVGAKPGRPDSATGPALQETPRPPGDEFAPDVEPTPGAGSVAVTVDTAARPGAVVSGNVKFSDGKTAMWHLDQLGRLGTATAEKGYRPSPVDMQKFQAALEQELARLGF